MTIWTGNVPGYMQYIDAIRPLLIYKCSCLGMCRSNNKMVHVFVKLNNTALADCRLITH